MGNIENNLLDYSISKKSIENLKLWQKNIFKFCYSLTTIMIIVEIVFYFVYVHFNSMELTFNEYFTGYVIRPFIINTSACIIGTFLHKRKKIKNNVKKIFPILTLLTICSSLIIVHHRIPSVYAIHMVPIFLSTIYGDRKMERIVMSLSYIELTFCFYFISVYEANNLPSRYTIICLVTFVVLGFAHTLSQKLITYHMENSKIITNAIFCNENLKENLLHDGLTKLYNHSAFSIYLDKTLSEENEDIENNIQLAVIDIDFFKKVNDTFGHEVGNVVLKKIASILKEDLNEENIFLARYGGEEFVMMFKNMKIEETHLLLEEKRKKVEEYIFEEMQNKNVTFSAGLATFKNNYSPTKFIKIADAALYEAKNNGRNNIFISTNNS